MTEHFIPREEEIKLKKISSEARKNNDKELLEKTQNELANLYASHGEYFKMSDNPDPRVAKEYFEKALEYNSKHPIANYRWAYLLYKEEEYARAIYHFNLSLDGSKYSGLNDTQVMLAHMFIVNCGFYLAEESLKEIADMEDNPYTQLEMERIERYQKEIKINSEHTLNRMFYRKITNDKTEVVNEEEFMRQPSHAVPQVTIRVSDSGKELFFMDYKINLEPQAFNILYCLLRTEKYITNEGIATILLEGPLGIEVSEESIRQTISRFNRRIPFWEMFIESVQMERRRGRKLRSEFSYCILCRASDILPDGE